MVKIEEYEDNNHRMSKCWRNLCWMPGLQDLDGPSSIDMHKKTSLLMMVFSEEEVDLAINQLALIDEKILCMHGGLSPDLCNLDQRHDLDLICRAHQVVEDGYEFFANRQLVTIFSAPNYCGEFDNAGAMMSVDDTLMCSFQILKLAEKKKFSFGSTTTVKAGTPTPGAKVTGCLIGLVGIYLSCFFWLWKSYIEGAK